MKLGRPGALLRYLGRSPELLAACRQTSAPGPLVMRYLGIGRRRHRYPFRIRLRGGTTLTLRDPEEVKVFWQIFVRGCYKLPPRCDTILDCGANVGIFSVWAARQRPSARIVALEPFAETFSALQAQISGNGLAHRVECVQAGLAGASGQRWMQGGSDSPRRKVMPAEAVTPVGTAVAVHCVTLAHALETFNLQPLDLLKMDIEGSEFEVLLSTPPAVLSRIRHIQLEYHQVRKRLGHTPEELIGHLAKAGHRLVWRTEDAHHTGLAYLERAA